MPNVRDILFAWLVEHGYDGLFNEDECGCNLDALLPCERCCDACQPGYKHPGDEHAEWYIRPEKPEEIGALADALAEYEAEHYPIDPPTPEAAAEFRREQEEDGE